MSITRAHLAFAMRSASLRATPPVDGTWTPSSLGASLKAWWNADDHGTANMTDDGAGLISAWKDRVSAINMTATTTARATWAATSFNAAYAGLTFDGTANAYVIAGVPAALPQGSTGGEIWAVASQTALGSAALVRNLMRYGDTAASTYRGLFRQAVSSVNRTHVGDGGATLIDTAIDLSGPHIMGGAWAGTTESGRIDGRDFTPRSATIATLATGTVRTRIGAANASGASQWWQGVIRHVIVTLTLTDAQREQMEGWAAFESGLRSLLPSSHPFKSVRP